MSSLTPREIVSELNKYVIGQAEAKRMVAIAMRNRWRRQKLDPELREEIAPKNIIMMGPTGVGKTEIARRLAKLAKSPFHKVEATKFTEVGYVGRDVESMIRDLMEIGITMVRTEEREKVRVRAEGHAEDRLLDLLLPGSTPRPGGYSFTPIPDPASPQPAEHVATANESTREKFRQLWREGKLDERMVELEVATQEGSGVSIMGMPGMEDMGGQVQDMLGRFFPQKKKLRKMKVKDAFAALVQEESDKLIDMDKVQDIARERVEQSGIIFLDELDKIASRQDHGGPDVSREGVQRDLLPVVEGCVVNTKYGMVKTDHILFIAAGAFHYAKPSDLIPELQGRFPLRVELSALGADEFYRILTEPQNALTVQYSALLGTEGLSLTFTDDALHEIAATAQRINEEAENIGARRLYTIMEKILAELSFEASDKGGQSVVVDREYVRGQLTEIVENRDLSRYIL
ncbi:MAG TPA: ATP-dependent protease ATPase subunit HslU [Humidesulfovibrio sp.]|uniref:ATP-dependent protease ATPase subunit HslU n=1 Tax=Humidesulfovibrio sp. TaxID=2910988 RepID=UPI002C988E32|nr:ATP-dependent protease ATPase subunit HslU [Humidesulfovibrio sp.]HWR04583.1 ATP-dependent protease ATPase subunit HslU [Humidesulfovibrio sp.]